MGNIVIYDRGGKSKELSIGEFGDAKKVWIEEFGEEEGGGGGRLTSLKDRKACNDRDNEFE